MISEITLILFFFSHTVIAFLMISMLCYMVFLFRTFITDILNEKVAFQYAISRARMITKFDNGWLFRSIVSLVCLKPADIRF